MPGPDLDDTAPLKPPSSGGGRLERLFPAPSPRPRRLLRSSTLAIARDNDSRVAEMAVKRGLVDEESAGDCLRALAEARARGEKVSVARLMVQRGLLTEYQATELTATAATTGEGASLGGFRIIDKLGEGAMGTVYMAVQVALDRVVALKVLPERLARNPEYIERFLREAKVAARLEHANIVRAIDVGESQGRYYFAMELVEGRSLESILKERGSLSEEEAVDVALQAAEGLGCAWRHGLIHRDIKPDNLLVTYEGVVKIADLGLARGVSASGAGRLTQEGMTFGTPQYISPEQARAEDLDIRTDIYALGVTLYRALTGEFPFEGDDPFKLISARLKADPKPVRQVNPKLTREIEQVVETMMARERDNRYPDPLVLLRDLDRVAGGERPEYAGRRESVRLRAAEAAHGDVGLGRWVAGRSLLAAPMRTFRRRPGLVAAAAALVIAAAGAAVFLGRERIKPTVDSIGDTLGDALLPAGSGEGYEALLKAALKRAVAGEYDEALALLERAGDVKETREVKELAASVLRAQLIDRARDAELADKPAEAIPLYERALEIADDKALREHTAELRLREKHRKETSPP